MARAVDAAMKGNQLARIDEVVDYRLVKHTQQLPPGHDPVLRACHPRDELVRSKLSGYSGVKLLHSAILARPASPLNAKLQRNRAETAPALPSSS